MKRETDSTGMIPFMVIMLLVWLVVCLVAPDLPTTCGVTYPCDSVTTTIYNNNTTTQLGES